MKIIPIKKIDNSVYGGYEEARFAIADDDGKVIDDAGGYGYKTAQKAHKAMWYKFEGGKQKKEAEANERKRFFKEHKGLDKYIDEILEYNIKEIARGELTDQDILDDIKKEFGVDIPKKFLYD
jgi:hypothetical protein